MNSFLKTINELRRGACVNECAEKMAALVAAVRERGGKGELTLTLRIKPATAGDEITMSVCDEVTIKPPRVKRPETLYFASEENCLQRQDPRQHELPLAAVDGGQESQEQNQHTQSA